MFMIRWEVQSSKLSTNHCTTLDHGAYASLCLTKLALSAQRRKKSLTTSVIALAHSIEKGQDQKQVVPLVIAFAASEEKGHTQNVSAPNNFAFFRLCLGRDVR